jgi:LmbE family N-acetylglucosaminyl deacetylase
MRRRLPRDRAESLARALRRHLAGRPIFVRPEFAKVLVIAPHPDDESIGCGGTLALLGSSGCRIEVVFVSDGSALRVSGRRAEDISTSRRREAEAACEILNASPSFLGLPDGDLESVTEKMADELHALIADGSPDAIFVPWFLDGHPDHIATSQALARSSAPGPTQVWAYEVWTPLPPNRLVDITSVVDVKASAVAEYKSDPKLDLPGMLAINSYRAAANGMKDRAAEAFLSLSLDEYVQQMAEAGVL